MGYEIGEMQFSVIIPVLNEESTIGRCISNLDVSSHDVEILVVDGGSNDGTPKVAGASGARVLQSPAGRGPQMNTGAHAASGTVLVFLHADTIVPPGVFDFLSEQFVCPGLQFGAFRTSYNSDSFLLRVYSFFTRFESGFTTFGDQCFVMRRDFFQAIGGFPEWPLFEDVEFLRRARRVTTVRKFPVEIRTSARKFLKGGIAVQQLRNIITMILFHFGVSPQRLYRRYYGIDLKKEGASNAKMNVGYMDYPLPSLNPVPQSEDRADTFSDEVSGKSA